MLHFLRLNSTLHPFHTSSHACTQCTSCVTYKPYGRAVPAALPVYVRIELGADEQRFWRRRDRLFEPQQRPLTPVMHAATFPRRPGVAAAACRAGGSSGGRGAIGSAACSVCGQRATFQAVKLLLPEVLPLDVKNGTACEQKGADDAGGYVLRYLHRGARGHGPSRVFTEAPPASEEWRTQAS